MFDSLWVDAHLATMIPGPEPYGSIRDGAVGIRGGHIAWIGRRADLPGTPGALARQVHSAEGGWITPGLIDCHTHAVFGGNRAQEFEARLRGISYAELARQGGGILSTVRATRAASREELTRGAAFRLQDLATDGVTTVEVKSGYGLTVADELRMLRAAREAGPMAGVEVKGTLLALHAVPPEFSGRRDAYLDLAANEMLPAALGEGLITAVDAFLEGIAFAPREVEPFFRRARDAGLVLRLHADQLEDGDGGRYAAEWGAASADHLEYTSDDGARAMGRAGVTAVLLPGAYLVLGAERRPPVASFRNHGVDMAVATDLNPGSSPVRSLRLAMNLACTLFGLTPEEALCGVTRHAASAMGLSDRGQLREGLRADLAIWGVDHPSELSYWLGGASPLLARVKAGVPVHA
ncbi:MAG: imidazolonepropionase [Gemmatimonadales bacterium]|jgi:imidazolonepropionase|nr:MAG: imidazolonepropionase [Gemmatimonadales bacterium]